MLFNWQAGSLSIMEGINNSIWPNGKIIKFSRSDSKYIVLLGLEIALCLLCALVSNLDRHVQPLKQPTWRGMNSLVINHALLHARNRVASYQFYWKLTNPNDSLTEEVKTTNLDSLSERRCQWENPGYKCCERTPGKNQHVLLTYQKNWIDIVWWVLNINIKWY